MGGVDFATKRLVKCERSRQDDGLSLDLDSTFTQMDMICAISNKARGVWGNGQIIVVSTQCLS